MPAMPAKRTLLDKMIQAVRNDPQKAGILTVLVAILVVLQIRLQMSGGEGGSSQATAAEAVDARPDNADDRVGSRTGENRSQDAGAALRDWMDAPSVPLGRNLFAINLERFPQDGTRTSASTNAAGFWDELAKSMTFRADVRKERQILVENLQQQASQLRLQSTMMGATPKAVIDGELVGEGEFVASFRVLRIEARRIIVEREGIKLEIQMR
jgi:hypothetical protein